jgi:hypothetical protein
MLNPPPPSRASPAPTGVSVVHKSTNTPQIIVGASLLAIALGQTPSSALALRFREQAHSYRVLRRTQICENPTNPCGSGLARESGGSGTIFGTDTPLSRAGSLLQGFAPYTNLRKPHKSLWERACSRRRWVRQHLRHRHSAFASRLTPTGVSGVHKFAKTPQIPVGASLLAKAVGQATFSVQTFRFREQAHSYRVLRRTQICEHPTNLCRS